MDHFAYRAGSLFCEDTALDDLAQRVGTPTYVYSRATLTDHYDRLATAFRDLGPTNQGPLICYSVKSCGNLSICRALGEQGAGMDVVSGGELERAWLAGVPMSKVVYAGVGKTDAEILAALDGRHSPLRGLPPGQLPGGRSPDDRGPIGWFNVESEPEFETIAALARKTQIPARAALRVNPDVDPKTHAYTTTGKKESKFGVDLERALAFFRAYGRDEWLKLTAVHLHIGSPVYTTEPYVEAITKALALIDQLGREGFRVDTLDLGGGFGADYETGRSPEAADYAEAIVPLLRDRVRSGLRVILEPGRTISANAGVLLTRVVQVKQSGSKSFVICDAGMNALIRPALYGAFHFVWPTRVAPEHVPPRRAEELDLPGLQTCDVVGPICESGDFLAKGRKIPPVKRGDLVAVFTAGRPWAL
jgi:diaminopimelate decarboxylase